MCANPENTEQVKRATFWCWMCKAMVTTGTKSAHMKEHLRNEWVLTTWGWMEKWRFPEAFPEAKRGRP